MVRLAGLETLDGFCLDPSTPAASPQGSRSRVLVVAPSIPTAAATLKVGGKHVLWLKQRVDSIPIPISIPIRYTKSLPCRHYPEEDAFEPGAVHEGEANAVQEELQRHPPPVDHLIARYPWPDPSVFFLNLAYVLHVWRCSSECV